MFSLSSRPIRDHNPLPLFSPFISQAPQPDLLLLPPLPNPLLWLYLAPGYHVPPVTPIQRIRQLQRNANNDICSNSLFYHVLPLPPCPKHRNNIQDIQGLRAGVQETSVHLPHRRESAIHSLHYHVFFALTLSTRVPRKHPGHIYL